MNRNKILLLLAAAAGGYFLFYRKDQTTGETGAQQLQFALTRRPADSNAVNPVRNIGIGQTQQQQAVAFRGVNSGATNGSGNPGGYGIDGTQAILSAGRAVISVGTSVWDFVSGLFKSSPAPDLGDYGSDSQSTSWGDVWNVQGSGQPSDIPADTVIDPTTDTSRNQIEAWLP